MVQSLDFIEEKQKKKINVLGVDFFPILID